MRRFRGRCEQVRLALEFPLCDDDDGDAAHVCSHCLEIRRGKRSERDVAASGFSPGLPASSVGFDVPASPADHVTSSAPVDFAARAESVDVPTRSQSSIRPDTLAAL